MSRPRHDFATRVAFILVSMVGLATFATAPASPPNIVMIIGDDQAWTDYGFMGHPHIRTPHIDRLAENSLAYRRGYVPSSLCRPSLASMITGLYPHQHAITCNDPPLPKGKTGAAANKDTQFLAQRQEMIAYIDKVPTLPRLLEKNGYVSFQSGKWWEGNACRCGFTDGMTHGDPARGGRHGDEGLKIGREGLKPIFAFLNDAKSKGKPFYLWYAPMMPHTPHNPPARLLEKYRDKTPSIHVARYWAMCEWFDESVGELLRGLQDTGAAENTLVVFLCDNGWIQDPNSANYGPKSKRSPYDGGLRTPILLRWPGRIKPRFVDAAVSSIDVAPTILHAVGLKPPQEMQGVNLLDADAVAKRPSVFGEVFEHNAVDIHQPASNLQFRWIVHGQWKLIVPARRHLPDGKPELYDLASDSLETKNLSADQPQRVAELRTLLDQWWRVE